MFGKLLHRILPDPLKQPRISVIVPHPIDRERHKKTTDILAESIETMQTLLEAISSQTCMSRKESLCVKDARKLTVEFLEGIGHKPRLFEVNGRAKLFQE